jgi:hypothetical protein
LRWLLLLEEYGVTFEYLPGKKNVVADALSRLDIDSLKIQEEDVLTLLSGSVTFEYLPGKKNIVADALPRLDIDSLKIQEEEV